MIKIPLIDQNDFIVEAALEGATYFLHFSWNSEVGYWVMSIESAFNEAILSGVVLSPNTPLLKSFHHTAVPPGEFIAYVDDRTTQRIGRNDFLSGKAALYYLTEEEHAPV